MERTLKQMMEDQWNEKSLQNPNYHCRWIKSASLGTILARRGKLVVDNYDKRVEKSEIQDQERVIKQIMKADRNQFV